MPQHKWKPYKWLPERKKEPAHRNILASLQHIENVGRTKEPAFKEQKHDQPPWNVIMYGTPEQGRLERKAALHAFTANMSPQDMSRLAPMVAAARGYEGGGVYNSDTRQGGSPRPGNIMGELDTRAIDVPFKGWTDPGASMASLLQGALMRTQFGWASKAAQNRLNEARNAGQPTGVADIFHAFVVRRTPANKMARDTDPGGINVNALPGGGARLADILKKQKEIDRFWNSQPKPSSSQLRGVQRFREKERQRAFGAK